LDGPDLYCFGTPESGVSEVHDPKGTSQPPLREALIRFPNEACMGADSELASLIQMEQTRREPPIAIIHKKNHARRLAQFGPVCKFTVSCQVNEAAGQLAPLCKYR
jgi:hypothetical protein